MLGCGAVLRLDAVATVTPRLSGSCLATQLTANNNARNKSGRACPDRVSRSVTSEPPTAIGKVMTVHDTRESLKLIVFCTHHLKSKGFECRRLVVPYHQRI